MFPAGSLDGRHVALGRDFSSRPARGKRAARSGDRTRADPGRRWLFAAVLSDRPSRNADLRRRSFGYFQDPS